MAPQAFVPIHRRPKSELKGPGAAKPESAPAPSAAKVVAKKPVTAPAKRAKSSSSSFPVLPALAATLLVLGGAQAGIWWWGKMGDTRAPVSVAHTATPHAVDAPRMVGTLNVPPLPQNLQFGDVLGRVTITIFSDPSCGACRARTRELIGSLPAQGVRYVYKFWPDDPSHATPGLLMELARREGAIAKFWGLIQASGAENLDDTALLHLLDRAGVPLAAQREALAGTTPALTQALEPDLRAAATANLPAPPVLVVNSDVLDTASLTPTSLNQYVVQLLGGTNAGGDTPVATRSGLRHLLPSR
ncbi:MAG: hypothetical protein DI585_00255 [Pseudomonas fluorescens]|nr:MAG: hypothetical protein DI585_00255 [Pseudomonas fluorescens]